MSVLERIVRHVRPGVTELMVHPGFVDNQLPGMNAELLDSRREEINLLCDARIWRLLIDNRIRLVRHDYSAVAERGARDVA